MKERKIKFSAEREVETEDIEVKTPKQILLETIKAKQLDKAETLFMEMAEKDEDTMETCIAAAAAFHRISKSDKFQEIAGLHLLQLLEKKQYKKIYDLTKAYAKYVNDANDFHEPLVAAIQAIYSDNPNLKRYLRSSGLLNGNNIKEELKLFEMFLYCDEGEVFSHHSWGSGIIREVNTLEKKVLIDFENEKNKTMTFDGVKDFLQKIPHDHFKAMKIRELKKLKENAIADPGEFVKFLLKSSSEPLKANDIKNYFLELFPQDDWADWWKKAKDSLRFDPMIDLKDGIQAEVKFRSEGRDFYDDLIGQIEISTEFKERYNLVRSFIRQKSVQPPKETQVAALYKIIKDEYSKNLETNPSAQFEYCFLYDEILNGLGGDAEPLSPSVDDIIASSKDLKSLLLNMSFHDYQIDAAKKIMEKFPPEEWKKIFSDIFSEAPVKLAAFLGENLIKNDGLDYLNQASHRLYEDYEKNPETFIWLAKQILGGSWNMVSSSVSTADLFLVLIHYLELLRHRLTSMERSDAEFAKKLQTQIRAIINEKKFTTPIKIYQAATPLDAKRIFEAVTTSPALSSTTKQSLSDTLKSARKDIKFGETSEESDAGQSFYVTKESYERKQKDLEILLTIEIPKNSKDIEIAREKGDLRENAEYEAAKNKQNLLMTQVGELKNLINRAKIINKDVISKDTILVGNRFVVRNILNGTEETYTLLGPWDAKPEEHIISYLSPFANQFMNKKVGDKFNVAHTSGTTSEYEVIKIESAFDSVS